MTASDQPASSAEGIRVLPPSPRPASEGDLQCPDCGAQVGASDHVCWMCHAPLVMEAELVATAAGSPFVPEWEQKRRTNPAQFSLESLMLVITLIAVCLGMFVAVPGLGVLVCIVAVPALVRTLIVGRHRKEAAAPLNLGEKVMAFLASTGIVMGILLAGLSAFAVACVGTCFAVMGIAQTTTSPRQAEGLAVYSAFIAGPVVALAVVAWLAWLTWPRRRKST